MNRAQAATCPQANTEAFVISQATPVYPPDLRARGVEGNVIVRITIGVDGSVTAASILTSSGNTALDKAAIAAARASKFSPKIVNCVPTVSTYAFKSTFVANGPDVSLDTITIVSGVVGYARLGIEMTRVQQLTDNAAQLRTQAAQQYIDRVVHDVLAIIPDRRTEVEEVRQELDC